MSFEFSALTKNPVSHQIFSQCITKLLSSQRYELESLVCDKAKLRYAGMARRKNWPEDFTILLESSRIFVAIYAGTATDRKVLIDKLVEAFELYETTLMFEEV